MTTRKEIILTKHLTAMQNTIGIKIDPKTHEFIHRAMLEYANEAIKLKTVRDMKARRRLIYALVGIWGKAQWSDFTSKIRAFMLKKAIAEAQRLSNLDRRKRYVIRSTEVAYRTFSTYEIDFNKRIRVFGKDVDAKKLSETADRVILPKK